MLSQLEDCLERWKFLFREKLLNIPIIRGISHFESVFIIRSGATALFSKRIKLVRRYLFHSYSPPGQDRICECIPLFSLLFHVAVVGTLVFTAPGRETGRAFEPRE